VVLNDGTRTDVPVFANDSSCAAKQPSRAGFPLSVSDNRDQEASAKGPW